MTIAEQLKQEESKAFNEWEYKQVFLGAVTEYFRNNRGSRLRIMQNPPCIDKGHIRIIDGRYFSQQKKYPAKFNYPHDEFILGEDVTDCHTTHLRYYDNEDMARKAEILKENGFTVLTSWEYGYGDTIKVYL